MAVRPPFDASRDFVVGRGFTFLGVAYAAGELFEKNAANEWHLRRLYDTRAISFAPVDIAPAQPAGAVLLNDPVTIEPAGGNWHEVSAPWLDAPIKVNGKKKAEDVAAQIREAGEPLSWGGVMIATDDDGIWMVKADWQEEPEIVDDEQAARDRANELRAAGAPEPKDPEQTGDDDQSDDDDQTGADDADQSDTDQADNESADGDDDADSDGEDGDGDDDDQTEQDGPGNEASASDSDAGDETE